MAADRTELRVEIPAEELSVLDAYCSANGRGRTDVIRMLLKDWSDKKRHEAMVIMRVIGVNPTQSDKGRSE